MLDDDELRILARFEREAAARDPELDRRLRGAFQVLGSPSPRTKWWSVALLMADAVLGALGVIMGWSLPSAAALILFPLLLLPCLHSSYRAGTR